MKNIIIAILAVVILGGVGYVLYEKNKSKKTNETPSQTQSATPTETTNLDTQNSGLREFKNDDHKLSLEYPKSWNYVDLGGAKNVTTPLARENIGYFELPNEEKTNALASVKLLRFVIEDETEIESASDWQSYIQTKIDDFIANTELSKNYIFGSLEIGDEVDGKFTVVENYSETGDIIGKDFYIYNGVDFYQFVTKIDKDVQSQYTSTIKDIVYSLKLEK